MLIIGKIAQVRRYMRTLHYLLTFSQYLKLLYKIKSIDKAKKKEYQTITGIFTQCFANESNKLFYIFIHFTLFMYHVCYIIFHLWLEHNLLILLSVFFGLLQEFLIMFSAAMNILVQVLWSILVRVSLYLESTCCNTILTYTSTSKV